MCRNFGLWGQSPAGWQIANTNGIPTRSPGLAGSTMIGGGSGGGPAREGERQGDLEKIPSFIATGQARQARREAGNTDCGGFTRKQKSKMECAR